MFDKGSLTGHVALVHCPNLRDSHMGFVDDQNKIVREEVQQSVRGGARTASVDVARIVLNPSAGANLAHHLQVVGGAHPQPLSLKQFSPFLKPLHPVFHLFLNGGYGALHALLPRHIVAGREHVHSIHGPDHVPRKRVQDRDGINFVAKKFNPDRQFLIHGDDLHRVPTNTKGAARELHVVTHILHLNEPLQQLIAPHLLPDFQLQHPRHILFRGAQAVNA